MTRVLYHVQSWDSGLAIRVFRVSGLGFRVLGVASKVVFEVETRCKDRTRFLIYDLGCWIYDFVSCVLHHVFKFWDSDLGTRVLMISGS